jgi:hypothetical protein
METHKSSLIADTPVLSEQVRYLIERISTHPDEFFPFAPTLRGLLRTNEDRKGHHLSRWHPVLVALANDGSLWFSEADITALSAALEQARHKFMGECIVAELVTGEFKQYIVDLNEPAQASLPNMGAPVNPKYASGHAYVGSGGSGGNTATPRNKDHIAKQLENLYSQVYVDQYPKGKA